MKGKGIGYVIPVLARVLTVSILPHEECRSLEGSLTSISIGQGIGILLGTLTTTVVGGTIDCIEY